MRKVSGTSTDDEDTTISELSGKSGPKTASIMQRLFSPMKSSKTGAKVDTAESEKLESVPEPGAAVEVSIDDAKAYVDENTSENEKCECNACVIS